jgi:hypothetical protein
MEEQQLKPEQAWERLQLNQSRDESAAVGANAKIDYKKIRMPRFIRHLQSFRNRRRGMPREFTRAGKIDNLIRGSNNLIGEFIRQENGRLRNPKIGWPFLSLIYAAHQSRIFFLCKVSVESRAKLRIHCT